MSATNRAEVKHDMNNDNQYVNGLALCALGVGAVFSVVHQSLFGVLCSQLGRLMMMMMMMIMIMMMIMWDTIYSLEREKKNYIVQYRRR